jgi:hypothetical protein
VVAYAGDVTTFVSSVTEFEAVDEVLGLYEKATPPNLKRWHLEDEERRKLRLEFVITSLSPF